MNDSEKQFAAIQQLRRELIKSQLPSAVDLLDHYFPHAKEDRVFLVMTKGTKRFYLTSFTNRPRWTQMPDLSHIMPRSTAEHEIKNLIQFPSETYTLESLTLEVVTPPTH